MSKYLLEIGVEELPYKFIPMAISQLENGFKTFIHDFGSSFCIAFFKFTNCKVHIFPPELLTDSSLMFTDPIHKI